MKLIKHNSGKRKRSRARILIQPGTGNIIVNNMKLEEYVRNNNRFIQSIIECIRLTKKLKKKINKNF